MIGSIVSHYEILETLGGGGMGVVYKARDIRLDRLVALKFLPPDLTNEPSARSRFIREAKAASALQHNNICAIHDIEQTEDGRIFICMDFYEGETLKIRMQKRRVSFQEVQRIARQLAEGLREAHRHGIVHRDIKPANIFITRQDVVKILDFGLAKLSDSTVVSREGSTAGTPAYMSPEQTRGEVVDQRTDIWSFGVVLYEMLTGQRPFRGEHGPAIMYSINNEEPTEPSAIDHNIPAEWSSFCMRCLRKNRQERLTTLDEASILFPGTAQPAGPGQRLFSRIPSYIRWGAVVPALVAVGFLIWYLVPERSISLERTDTVIVADCENRTENPIFNHSLTEGLRVSLRQSDRINILSSDQVEGAREFLKIPPDRPLDEQTALSVARRQGARAVIAANVSRLGSKYILQCGIIDAASGETIRILRREVDRIEATLSGLDDLCRDVRKSLGESMSQISRAGMPLAEVTTPSLQALELYSQSDRIAAEGRYKEAAMLLEKAVALDSQFVIAIADLAYDYRKIGMDSLASYHHSRILPLIHRATEREKLEILAVYYGPSFEMDFPMAFEQLQQLTVRYPANAFAYATLGHLAMFAGNTKAALEANAKAVALYPQYDKTCYNNTAFALALNGQPAEALSWFHRAKALRPEYSAIDGYLALAYWMKESYDSAAAVLQPVLSSDDLVTRNRTRVILSCLEYFRGALQPAKQLCLDGIRECREYKKPWDEAYFHYLLGECEAAEGLVKEYRAEMARAVTLSASPYFELPLVCISYARRGVLSEAEELIRRIGAVRSYDPLFVRRRPHWVNLMKGQLSMAKGEFAKARKQFEAVERVQAGDPFYLLARKGAAECAARASDSSAVGLYEFILSRRGESMMGSLSSIRQCGVWTRWLWPEVELGLATYYASTKRADLAEKYAEAALSCWKDAEAGDVQAAHARNLLQRITTPH